MRPLSCFSVAVLAALAQQTAPPANPTPPPNSPPITLVPRSHDEREDRFRARHRILLNVQVADPAGNPAANLKPRDFTLLVDSQPHPIVGIRPVSGATGLARPHVILLLNALNSTPAELDAERKSIETWLAQSQSPLDYPTAIAVLSDAGAGISPSVRDRSVLAVQLNSFLANAHTTDCFQKPGSDSNADDALRGGGLVPSPKGTSGSAVRTNCLNQHFQRSVTTLDKLAHGQPPGPGRVLVVWLGPAGPCSTAPISRPTPQTSNAIPSTTASNSPPTCASPNSP